MMVNSWIVIGRKYFMQLKTNIIGLFLISLFTGCGIFDTTETNNNVTKLYVTLQQQDKVAI